MAGAWQIRNRAGDNVRFKGRSANRRDPYEGANWIESSLSYANGDCVQAARLPDGRIGLRDSKNTAGPVLFFTTAEWSAFLGGVRNGEFDEL
jgi:Domain of unknown function (DUF397)